MQDRVGVVFVYRDEVLGYEPVKAIYQDIIKHYPDLIAIAKDKTKRKLKPLVLYKSDLDALEAEMVKNYGADTSHTPVVWRVEESKLHDDTFTNGIPAKGDDGDEDPEDEKDDEPKKTSPPPKKK